MRSPLALFVLVLLCLLTAPREVLAQANFTFVSPSGSDTESCTQTAPCKTFNYAYGKTAAYGEIVCLQEGLYGYLNITKSITINCVAGSMGMNNGGSAVYACSPNGSTQGTQIYIGIGPSQDDPTPMVRLKGLSINYQEVNKNQGVGAGIIISGSGPSAVYIEDVKISGTTRPGIIDCRTGGQTRLYVSDSVILNSSAPGIVANSQATSITVLDRVSLLNNTYGLAVAAGNNVVVTRSTISGNTTAGVHADAGGKINVTNSVLSNNTTNVNAYGSVTLQENSIFFSNTAIAGSGAVSLGANRFSGNASIGSTPSPASGAPADVFNN